ncbi:MAG: peptide ABC transporter ATP-binding protein [Acidimicrobiaceae bacterium]|jgi:peptide/nickel transport system ATP-binding protein|nr:peptide ABC transporter ATP-binding protein [Acidimicrobiaceae bacterium]MDP6481729.1 ATP-binding cassette domain-containing protein [Acidimicrobiales bacterium]MDP6697766.1 ATP-binding cassette domain-containing protein [Acidimicrobiales bacterium]|tara:strand:+ start:4660 stop:5670 length:1011 start_codon:yes stop_codon:yes gene_type:complete
MAGSGTVQLRDSDDIVLRVENLVMEFPAGLHQVVHAVSDVSFDVRRGETLGIVGESGCGKSTTARALVQLPMPTSGTVLLDPGDAGEVELTDLDGEDLRCVRPRIQMIFQDPISSLNPRRRVKDIVGEGLAIWRDEHPDVDVAARVDEVLGAVGLDPVVAGCRRPHEFSGGQCQRISIARALAIDPEILICDEPVSALDVSVQAQILNILEEMKERFGLTLVFISHDLSVVRNVSDRVVVMYLGKVCEIGDADTLFSEPSHPYTRVLLASAPEPSAVVDASESAIGDEIPSPIDPPSGCRFRTRCPRATEICASDEPVMREMGSDHFVACHFPGSP